jgi:cell division septum initiation protein DivIVA
MHTQLTNLSDEQIIYRAENRFGDELLAEVTARFDALLSEVEQLSQTIVHSETEIARLNRTASVLESRIAQIQAHAYA